MMRIPQCHGYAMDLKGLPVANVYDEVESAVWGTLLLKDGARQRTKLRFETAL